MAMLLDYGTKTVTLAPKLVQYAGGGTITPVKGQGAIKSTFKPSTGVLNVRQQVQQRNPTPALATALKPSPTKTVIPTVLQGGSIAVSTVSQHPQIDAILKPGTVALNNTELPINAVVKKTNTQAVTTLVNSLMGQRLRTAPNFQKVFATVQTKQLLGAISNKGYELAPKGTIDNTATLRDQYNVLYSINEELVARQTEYVNTQDILKADLARQANQASVYEGQLSNLQGQYSELQQAYQDLLANPPQKDDLLGGIGDFLGKYGLWIALGVGAIILLPPILRAFGGKD